MPLGPPSIPLLRALTFTALVVGGVSSSLAAATDGNASPSFAREVLPLLSDHCFACHGPDEQARKGGLRLDTRDGLLQAGTSGKPPVIPGQRTASELFRRLAPADSDDLMPPAKFKKPLSPEQVERLGRWIDAGAPWDQHWAYAPVVRPTPPRPTRDASGGPGAAPDSGPGQAIDAFVAARLRREGLGFSPEADRSTLLRRVTLDLTGLPPTPEELDAFVADGRGDAYERVVERLLASPRFGERMAWEWLEAARYADSNGYQGDADRTMWPWRDWVVDAFNRNLPYDQFTLWQLAGDLLPNATFEQRLATGFLRNHAINGEGGRIPEENRIEYLFDQTETVGTVWLGATLNCSRCHNHKYDPLTQRDYYGLLALFNRTAVDGSGGDPQSRPRLDVPSPELRSERTRLERDLAVAAAATEALELRRFPRAPGKPASASDAARDLPGPVRGHLELSAEGRPAGRLDELAKHFQAAAPDYAALLLRQRQHRVELDALERAVPRVMVMDDTVTTRDTFILTRGLYTQPGAKVVAGLPAAFGVPTPASSSPSNRLDLARWLVHPAHPLTARVTVNRFWQAFFGIGLVKTAEDFGLQGERPTHPELLDWLASEFIASGWNVKQLIHRIVTSRTYRQSSRTPPELRERDPENRLLARGPRHRLPSWMMRDVALAASGLLAPELGGPPVRPYQPAGVWEEATFGNKRYRPDSGAALYRRSLYVFWRRIVGPTMFFDVANRATCTVRTPRTNVPLHALLTLNDVTYVEAARRLAERVLTGPSLDVPGRLQHAARLVLGRRLDALESRRLEEGLARHRATFAADPASANRWLAHGESRPDPGVPRTELAAWSVVAQTLLNLDEALSKE